MNNKPNLYEQMIATKAADEKAFGKEIDDTDIYNFCDSRWNFYIAKDGSYYPSRHDKVVLQEAAQNFNISTEEAEQAFARVSKEKADAEIKGMSKTQMADLFRQIVEGNAETPWGQEALKRKS